MMKSSAAEPADSPLSAFILRSTLLLPLPSFFSHIYRVHLLPHFSLPALLSEGAEGQLHLREGDFAMNADTSQKP